MKLNQKLSAIAIGVLSFTTMGSPVLAEQLYFYVQNDANSAIKKLYVSNDDGKWRPVNIVIPPGATQKFTWPKSTDGESCTQWVKALFSDGEASEPTKVDFCEGLDDPIVFSE